MPPYPETPPQWIPTARRAVGPFTTHVSYRRPDGATAHWSSREHRKRSSRISRAEPSTWWAPRRASWWIGVLFALGSLCFVVAPFPGFLELVGSEADGAVFFAGSIGFTAAAALQFLEAINADPGPASRRPHLRLFAFEPHRIDWWSSRVQLIGTLLFNVSTWSALQTSLSTTEVHRRVWAPDAFGSVCFLVASYLAYLEVCGAPACRPRRSLSRWIAAVNLLGSVAFGVSAISSYVLLATGNELGVRITNAATAAGALCFLAGAVMLLPEGAVEEPSPAPDDAAIAAAA